jgi:hypothetical protein
MLPRTGDVRKIHVKGTEIKAAGVGGRCLTGSGLGGHFTRIDASGSRTRELEVLVHFKNLTSTSHQDDLGGL